MQDSSHPTTRSRRCASGSRPIRPWSAALLALAMLALSGCASRQAGSPATREQAAPLPSSTAASPLANWWQHFNDPTLSALVAQALQASPDVQRAQAALQQADALAVQQHAQRWPHLTLAASAQRSQTGDAATSQRFQTALDARWNPDLAGGLGSAARASLADAAAAAASLADVQVKLAAELALTYIDLRGLQARLGHAQSQLQVQSEALQIARWRAQAGLGTAQDIERALQASAQSSAQVPPLHIGIEQALHRLAVLSGQLPGSLPGSLRDPASIPLPQPDLAQAFAADTLRQRADVRAAEYRVSAAWARLAQAQAARQPSFSLSGSLGLSALGLGALSGGSALASALLAGISLPLFDAGAAQAQADAQQAAWEQARAHLRASVLSALQEVQDALVSLRGNTERLQHEQAALAAARQAEHLSALRLQAGLIDVSDLLDAQRGRHAAQDSLTATQARLSADHVRLYLALGGGWRPSVTAHPPAKAAQRSSS